MLRHGYLQKGARLLIRLMIALTLLNTATSAFAGGEADLCQRAAAQVARETGVPVDVLSALTLLETGHSHQSDGLQPWPWALNIGGSGHWPDTESAALAMIDQALASGQDSVDIGCFQINWRWHGRHFSSPRVLLEPQANARYAASFLSDLYQETGDWNLAAGAYHSRTEVHAAPYRARFVALRATLKGDSTPPFLARVNSFPLFQGGGVTAVLGSLVPMPGEG